MAADAFRRRPMARLGRMRDDEIFLCFDCGTKNRIRSGFPGVRKCGSCGVALRRPDRLGQPLETRISAQAGAGKARRRQIRAP